MLQINTQISKEENFSAGQVILIDKPLEWTSFDVVQKVRNAIKIRKIKIGHAGTLDPLATGLLILCTGKKTKEIESFMNQVKEYTGTFMLGEETPTYDLESEVSVRHDISQITLTDLEKARTRFLGELEQIPPVHSAIKVNGRRAYELARKGRDDIVLKPRRINISEFELTRIALPRVSFRVICSKGTYIRSLAHDFGRALGIGAHLSSLRRTQIGDFHVDNAYQLDDLIGLICNLKCRSV